MSQGNFDILVYSPRVQDSSCTVQHFDISLFLTVIIEFFDNSDSITWSTSLVGNLVDAFCQYCGYLCSEGYSR